MTRLVKGMAVLDLGCGTANGHDGFRDVRVAWYAMMQSITDGADRAHCVFRVRHWNIRISDGLPIGDWAYRMDFEEHEAA